MTKILLSLGLVAALAAPAMAQSAYDASANNVAMGANSGVQPAPLDPRLDAREDARLGVDRTVTNSIIRNDPVNHPMIQRGAQGEYFGANGR